HRTGPALVERGPQPVDRGVERLGPRHLDELAVLAHHRRTHTRLGVHPLVAVPTLVAQPALVDRFGVDTEEAHDPVRRALERATATDCARGARRLDGLEIPRTSAEPVGARSERAYRTDLHRVAGEVRRERLVGVGDHLRVATALAEVDERVTRDLGGE